MERRGAVTGLAMATVILLPPDADLLKKKTDQLYYDTYENEKPIIQKEGTRLGTEPFIKEPNQANLGIFADDLFEARNSFRSSDCNFGVGVKVNVKSLGGYEFGHIYARVSGDDLCGGSGLYACPEGKPLTVRKTICPENPFSQCHEKWQISDECKPIAVGGSGWDKNSDPQVVVYNNRFFYLRGLIEREKPVLALFGGDAVDPFGKGSGEIETELRIKGYRLDFREAE